MKNKIKELNELKEFCVSVDDIAQVNQLNYYNNLIIVFQEVIEKSITELKKAIEKCIDLKIVELKLKKEKEEKEKVNVKINYL